MIKSGQKSSIRVCYKSLISVVFHDILLLKIITFLGGVFFMDADPAGNTIIFDLLILVFFTLMNAFFAGAEMAVVSVNKNKIRSLAEEGNKKAIIIQSLFEDSTKFLSTIQIAITFAGFYSSASAAAGIAPVLGAWMENRGIPYSMAIARNGVTLLLMFFNLVFGELVPKRIALQMAEGFCMLTVMPIHYISIILSPFIKLLSVSTKVVLKLLHMKTEDQEEAVTEEEIKALLKMGSEHGTVEDSEREMINSIFSFADRTARELMVPRREVFTLDVEETLEDVLDEVLESRHTRIPVYEETVDNIIGILHVKDVMIAMRRSVASSIDMRSILREPFFVPDTKDADDLFRELQESHRHMAVLVDEYGGFSGIVTMEDLIEEITGEIEDEYDQVQAPDIQKIDDNTYLLHGLISLDDLNEELDLNLDFDEHDTLSGFLLGHIGHILEDGSITSVDYDNLHFDILKVEDKHIETVQLIIKDKE